MNLFEEFGQVDSPIQGRVHGTGLSLPHSKRLAELLGGAVTLRSAPAASPTFSLIIRRVFRGPDEVGAAAPPAPWRSSSSTTTATRRGAWRAS